MKYFFALFALLAAQTASAGNVLLEKNTLPGYVMPAYAVNKSCTIHEKGKLVVSYTLQQLTSERSTPLTLDAAAIKSAIDDAALGTITTGESTVDTGVVQYYAYQTQSDGTFKRIVLWETGGIGPRTNDSDSAILLRNFIDLNCGDPLQQ